MCIEIQPPVFRRLSSFVLHSESVGACVEMNKTSRVTETHLLMQISWFTIPVFRADMQLAGIA
jgi:hypothetical protein